VTAGDPTVVDRWDGTPIDGNPRLKKLLDDDGKGVVYEFYRRTGCFQANHHVIVQNRILEEHPWVALELFKGDRRTWRTSAPGDPSRRTCSFRGRISRSRRRSSETIRTPLVSMPWARMSSARSGAPWSRGCFAGRYGSRTLLPDHAEHLTDLEGFPGRQGR
jgi:hypothetical protein